MPTEAARVQQPWYRQPVAWLGALVFASLLAGCAWTVAISMRYTDVHMQGNVPTLLGVPAPATTHSVARP